MQLQQRPIKLPQSRYHRLPPTLCTRFCSTCKAASFRCAEFEFPPLVSAHSLLLNFGQFGVSQAANSEYDILETMNSRVASEHDRGVRVFVERLKQKNDGLSECMQEIDYEVTELESSMRDIWNRRSEFLVARVVEAGLQLAVY